MRSSFILLLLFVLKAIKLNRAVFGSEFPFEIEQDLNTEVGQQNNSFFFEGHCIKPYENSFFKLLCILSHYELV